MRLAVIALVGVEPHLAVPERAERLAVGIDIVGHQQHVVPLDQRVGADRARARRHALGDGTEIGGEAALIVLGQFLIAEHQHRVVVPGVLDLTDRFGIERAAEIDAADFGADDGMQLDDGNGAEPVRDEGHCFFSRRLPQNGLSASHMTARRRHIRPACHVGSAAGGRRVGLDPRAREPS